jgi:hypothetical protein
MPAPGRNDPCHCGSGKKYKNCHLAADREAAGARAAAEHERQERLEALGHPSDTEMRTLYQELTGRALPSGPIPDQARASVVEIWRQRRANEQALKKLAPERKRWEKHFQAHPEEFDAVAADLGREPFFDRYVLTNTNRRKVREKLGAPPSGDPEALNAYTAAAIALTLDKDDREGFKDGLLVRVSELVDEGRMKEATVVAVSAERAVDMDAPPSPFLRDVIIRSMQRGPGAATAKNAPAKTTSSKKK